MSNEHFLWVEKYRPKTVDECILPESLKNTFKQFIAGGELPTFLFSGGAGVGKTTVAKALCNEVGAEFMFINGSEENGIDVLRTKIKSFASSVSLESSTKVVILDEADNLTQATQSGLRSFIEEFSNNCRFIFTCNFKHKIIEPLWSRCAVVEFKIPSAEKPKVAGLFFRRVMDILEQEKITNVDSKAVAKLVETHFPDFRRVLNELQRYSVGGSIDTGILVNLSSESFKELIQSLKSKDFGGVRKWVAKNSDIDTSQLFRTLYDNSVDCMDQGSIPRLVLTLADYQYKAAFVADTELNTMAALTEVMANCKFK
jgi:DNA polymerase III delta prime subunit